MKAPPKKQRPHEVIVLIQPLLDDAVPVGTAATMADVPALLRRIADVWERRGGCAGSTAGR